MKSPTNDLYTTLEDAYCFFNDMLFQNSLPSCVIVLRDKGKNSLGYFAPERYVERTKKKKSKTVSELSLNPQKFQWQTDAEILSVLVHEMAHVWRYYCTDKKQPKNGYHDKLWGSKMKEIGLHPSNTGEPGGKETGQQMDHYIVKSGKFDLHVKQLLKTKKLQWNRMPEPIKSSKRNKSVYECPSCSAKVWGKPDMRIGCLECELEFIETKEKE